MLFDGVMIIIVGTVLYGCSLLDEYCECKREKERAEARQKRFEQDHPREILDHQAMGSWCEHCGNSGRCSVCGSEHGEVIQGSECL